MEEYVKKDEVIKLVLKYYDKFKYVSDADEALTDLEHMKGLELIHCKDCEEYEGCEIGGLCDTECMYAGCLI